MYMITKFHFKTVNSLMKYVSLSLYSLYLAYNVFKTDFPICFAKLIYKCLIMKNTLSNASQYM